MTQTQIDALRRIVERERSAYLTCPEHLAPGLHPSNGLYAVTDGTIFVKLKKPICELTMGDSDDGLAPMMEKELYLGLHLPYPKGTLTLKNLTEQKDSGADFITLAITDSRGDSVSAKFSIQALIDALEVVGENYQVRFGYGQQDSSAPTLLVFNKNSLMSGEPLAMVLSALQD